MSADCWRICPQCKVMHRREREKKDEAVSKAYGTITESEWLRMQREEIGDSVADLAETLREDYEMFIDEDGEFCVSYKASCESCGFQHSFSHEDHLKIRTPS